MVSKQRIYAAFLFIEITLPSGTSVRKDVWVQVPPFALKKLDFSSFFLFLFFSHLNECHIFAALVQAADLYFQSVFLDPLSF